MQKWQTNQIYKAIQSVDLNPNEFESEAWPNSEVSVATSALVGFSNLTHVPSSLSTLAGVRDSQTISNDNRRTTMIISGNPRLNAVQFQLLKSLVDQRFDSQQVDLALSQSRRALRQNWPLTGHLALRIA
jgi:hypothetical protein